jgi:hypothetical protein
MFGKAAPSSICDSSLFQAPRNIHIFPKAFGSKSHPSHSPHIFDLTQLHDALFGKYDPENHLEHTLVDSLEYCKQKSDPEHEFIIVTAKDSAAPQFVNYMVLDRTSNIPADRVGKHILATFSPSIWKAYAEDKMKISPDGDLPCLLKHCQISSYRTLERLDFPEKPLMIHELIAVSRAASSQQVEYRVFEAQCYWFAALVWDCVKRLRPEASSVEGSDRNLRGKFGFFYQRGSEQDLPDVLPKVKDELTRLGEQMTTAREVFKYIKYIYRY